MKSIRYLLVVATLFLAACGAQPTPEPPVASATQTSPPPTQVEPTATEDAPTVAPSPTAEQMPEPPQADYQGLSLPTDRVDLFAGSGICAACHTQMVDQAGVDVSIDAAWRSTMMANAARDPYWQAAVRGEILTNPEYEEIIEDTCATCHMPMARFADHTADAASEVLDEGYASVEHPLHPVAMDGVSCTLCHQIQPDGFGEPESFHGHFVINTEFPVNERQAYGPFMTGFGMMQIMQSSSGFIPVQGMHVQQAELCATCHTVYTPFVDAAGDVAGEFPEQVPYLEWQASSFSQSMSCQGCHMPTADGGVFLSIVGGHHLRSPVRQHTLVGGNTFILDMLRAFGQDLAVTASTAQFEEKMGETLAQLQGRTALVDLENASSDAATLAVDVVVRVMTGHKFPTAYPSRRAWIHLAVHDASGNVIFESGAVRANGSIAGNDNDLDPAAYEPHYLAIDSPEQVQIYEGIMGNTEGQPTTTLLAGASYLKDNRLLPAGFDKSAAPPDIAVYGAAADDDSFGAARDTTRYTVALDGAQGPFTITAELLYQSIGYRWADNMRQHDAPEPNRFLQYYEQIPNQAIAVASATMDVEE